MLQPATTVARSVGGTQTRVPRALVARVLDQATADQQARTHRPVTEQRFEQVPNHPPRNLRTPAPPLTSPLRLAGRQRFVVIGVDASLLAARRADREPRRDGTELRVVGHSPHVLVGGTAVGPSHGRRALLGLGSLPHPAALRVHLAAGEDSADRMLLLQRHIHRRAGHQRT